MDGAKPLLSYKPTGTSVSLASKNAVPKKVFGNYKVCSGVLRKSISHAVCETTFDCML
jgi:hypothetical protein